MKGKGHGRVLACAALLGAMLWGCAPTQAGEDRNPGLPEQQLESATGIEEPAAHAETPEEPAEWVEEIVVDFLRLLKNGELSETQRFLLEKYEYDEDYYLDDERFAKYLAHCTFQFVSENMDKEMRRVVVNVIQPDIWAILSAYDEDVGFITDSEVYTENRLRHLGEVLDADDCPLREGEQVLTLFKQGDDWLIENNYALSRVISPSGYSYYYSDTPHPKEERRRYIEDRLDLTDYAILETDTVNGIYGPSLSALQLRNQGDWIINKVLIRVQFHDSDGNFLEDTHKEIIDTGYNHHILKKGYGWVMDGSYLLDPPENTDLHNTTVVIADIELQGVEAVPTQIETYIAENMEISHIRFGSFHDLFWDGPSITELSIENRGDRSIHTVTILLTFRDSAGVAINEKELVVFGGWMSMDPPIEPHSTWSMGSDIHYPVRNLPPDVDIANYEVQISGVVFGD